jgi:hypothetical protein
MKKIFLGFLAKMFKESCFKITLPIHHVYKTKYVGYKLWKILNSHLSRVRFYAY